MSNNFDSNFTRKLMEKVLPSFETQRSLSRNVNTQLFQGRFDPSTGDSIDVQRPTDYTSVRTSDGDITGQKKDIITGKATATVQDYITVPVDYNEADEALKMGSNQSRFFEDMGQRIVTDLEVDFASFMMKNSGLRVGDVGTGVSKWSEVGEAGALMSSSGIPAGNWYYALNPYSQVALANEQRGLGVNPQAGSANEKAMVMENFAGMTVKTATGLATYTTGSGADRVGAVAVNPDVTYVTHKDTMKQSIAVSGFQANLVIAAGETIEIAARPRLNMSTKNPIIDASGNVVLFTGTVTQSVTLDGTGAGTLLITCPAIYEATGAYNSTASAVVAGDVVTLGGAADSVIQPNLFWHRDAFTIASVPMKKLHATDTLATTKDGLQLRVTKYANGDANRQSVRIDLRPAYGAMNQGMAGQAFGKA